MINSLYEINSALQNLSEQLHNNQTSISTLRNTINNLLSEVKYLDQKEKYNYYLLVAEIYAARFQNVEDAQKLLELFSKTLDSEVSMNCELRAAFFQYFRQNYKQSYTHLELGLGEVEEQLKLVHNANFFFSRIFNKEHLLIQLKEKSNFEAAFILSLIYQHENQETNGLKQLQHFIQQKNSEFIKFQLYKRFLQLYNIMKKNSISTISISKKSVQTYKEELAEIEQRHKEFQQKYNWKYKFVTRVVKFMNSELQRNNEKIKLKLLDYKLLAYYKLKKCSKVAPNKEIKMTLQNTAKIIKASKDTQLLENILNYDFIKKDYEAYRVFYNTKILNKIAAIKFLKMISDGTVKQSSYQQVNSSFAQLAKKQTSFSQLPKTQSSISQFPKTQSSISQPPKTQSSIQQVKATLESNPHQFLYSHKLAYEDQREQFFPSNSINLNKNSIVSNAPTFSKLRNEEEDGFQMKQTISQDILNTQFEGSKMYKLNASSEGFEERYFYVKLDSLKEKPRLYYCVSKISKSSADSYYSLKGLTQILRGKQTDALKRKEAIKFDQNLCFSLIFDKDKERSFYVPDEQDYRRWIFLLQNKLLFPGSNIPNMQQTMAITSVQSKYNNMNKSSPITKKSKVIQI